MDANKELFRGWLRGFGWLSGKTRTDTDKHGHPAPQACEGAALLVPHHPGARYRDAWNERDLGPRITDDGKAEIRLEIGAGEVGCVIQSW